LKTLVEIGQSKKYKRIFKKMKEIKKEDSEDEHVIVEREMFDFFKNDLDGTLSDVTLTAPKTNAAHKCHRIIIASASKYMLDIFKEYKVKDLKSIGIPEPMTCVSAAGHSDD